MSRSQTNGSSWDDTTTSCQTPRLTSHPVRTTDLTTPGTDDKCASGDPALSSVEAPSLGGCLESSRGDTKSAGQDISSHKLHPLPSTPSLSALSPASECSLQLPATSLNAQRPARPESPGVALHLIARAARCASPSLRFPEGASADPSPSLGLRALVGTVHATHRKAHSAAAITCRSADKLCPSDGNITSSGLRTCSPRPPAPPTSRGPSTKQASSAGGCTEQPLALLNPSRLHLDPAHATGPAPRRRHGSEGNSAFLRRRSRSIENPRSPSPALTLALCDTTTGAHGDALLRSVCSLGRMKPARARRNTRVRPHL